jgi:phosphohistidine phosphatase SixA
VTVAVREEIGFGFGVDHIPALIADADPDDEVIFVGHEPDLSIAVSRLIGGGELVMKKGGMARVDLFATAPLRGALVWVIPPKVFDDLAAQ